MLFTGRKYALIELLWNTEILIGGFWLLLLKGFAVPVVGIMPYFGGGLTENRWAFNRIEETVLPKVGIMTNRENGIFPFWLSPFFLEQRKGLLFFGGYLYLENMFSLCCTSCLRLGGRTAFRAWYRLPPPEWEACASYVEGNSPRRRTVDPPR
mgnify:CR=1 FL=1